MMASRRASAGDMPRRILSSTCSWRWLSISSASSHSRGALRNSSTNRKNKARSLLITAPFLQGPSRSNAKNKNSLTPGHWHRLLISQSHHRIDARRSARWNVARQQRDSADRSRHDDEEPASQYVKIVKGSLE